MEISKIIALEFPCEILLALCTIKRCKLGEITKITSYIEVNLFLKGLALPKNEKLFGIQLGQERAQSIKNSKAWLHAFLQKTACPQWSWRVNSHVTYQTGHNSIYSGSWRIATDMEGVGVIITH